MNVNFLELVSSCQYTYEIMGSAILLANNYIAEMYVSHCFRFTGYGREKTHSISVQEETDTGNKDDDPLIFLTVDCLVYLLHTYIAILWLVVSVFIITEQWINARRHTVSWSKSRALSVLYNRCIIRPMMGDVLAIRRVY